MSDYELKRINALPEASAINDSDVFAIDSAAGTKKVAWETLKGEVDADIAPIATAVEGIEESLADLKSAFNNLGLSVVDGAINITYTYQEVSE